MKISSIEAFIVSLICLAFVVAAPLIGIPIACVWGVILVFNAEFKYVPSITILLFARHNFPIIKSAVPAGIPIIGMYLNATLTITTAAAVYVLIYNRRLFNRSHRLLFFLWTIAFLPSSIISYKGYFEGNNGWSEPLRMLCVSGAFFYGILISKSFKDHHVKIFNLYIVVLTSVTALALFGLFHHRILWLNIALLAPAAISIWKKKDNKSKSWAITILGVTATFALGIWNLALEENNVIGVTTFTLMGLFVISAMLGIVYTFKIAELRSFAANVMGLPAFAIVIVFMIFSVNTYKEITVASGSYYELPIKERLLRKIFKDRARVWKANIDFILTPPYFLKPSGRTVEIEMSNGRKINSNFGAHNSFLQAICTNGWFSGLVVITILITMVVQCASAYRNTKCSEIRSLAIAVISTATYGAMTGHYVIGVEIGFLIHTLGGFASGFFISEKHKINPYTITNSFVK